MNKKPAIAWIPKWIDYVPSYNGVLAMGGHIVDRNVKTYASAIKQSLNMQSQSINGYYIAIYLY